MEPALTLDSVLAQYQQLGAWWQQVLKLIWPHKLQFGEVDKVMSLHVVPWTLVALYVPFVLLAPTILTPLSKLSVYKLFVSYVVKPLNFFWNVFLSVLSAVMLYNVALPAFQSILPAYAWQPAAAICDTKNLIAADGSELLYWMWLFGAMSKPMELVDTVFLVLKNPTRKVEFLHWYHHTTVLLFCWYAVYYRYGAALWFMVMNAFIHTFMYLYYALAELGHRAAWGKLLTYGQITQMFAGTAIVVTYAYQYFFAKQACPTHRPEVIIPSALVMYLTYLLLFVQFFFKRYDKNNVKNKRPSTGTSPVTPTDEMIKKAQ